jgi:tight adherence protein B
VVVASVAGAVIVLAEGETLAVGLVITGGAAGAWRLVASARARKRAQETADRVVEVCEALAGELRAGQPPLPALRHCAEVWPPLVEAATAAELGSDVVRALHRLAEVPGAAGLHEVAAAWQVSERSGGTMAPALASVADSARRRRATERLVASELASAQATARLIAVLPVVVLAMGSGLGGDPWGFLLTNPAGIGCLAAGLALAFLGLSWIERIAISAVRA